MQRKTQQGFTLIEIMVVLILLSIFTVAMVTTFNTDKIETHMENEMQRLSALLNLARDEATIHGQVMALALGEKTYRFDVLDIETGRWTPVTDSKAFRERPVLLGTTLSLVIDDIKLAKESEGFKLELSTKKVEDIKRDEDEEEDNYQRLQIDATGEIYPFELILRNETETIEFKLIINEKNELQIISPETAG